jgi:hypothetical protein
MKPKTLHIKNSYAGKTFYGRDIRTGLMLGQKVTLYPHPMEDGREAERGLHSK